MNTRRNNSNSKKQAGFSLIELLIVVAIILIIAAIAIPNYLRSRMAANESSAVGSMRTLTTALISYQSQCPTLGYPAGMANLGPGAGDCTAANLVQDTLSVAPNIKAGYAFVYTPGGGTPVSTYTLTGAPVTCNASGIRSFFAAEDAVIHYTDQPSCPGATAADSALQ